MTQNRKKAYRQLARGRMKQVGGMFTIMRGIRIRQINGALTFLRGLIILKRADARFNRDRRLRNLRDLNNGARREHAERNGHTPDATPTLSGSLTHVFRSAFSDLVGIVRMLAERIRGSGFGPPHPR